MKRVLLAVATFAVLAGAARAAEVKIGELAVAPNIMRLDDVRSADDKAFMAVQERLVKRPVLVSLVAEGEVVRQKEVEIEKFAGTVFVWDKVPAGVYDVKFEGVGIETVVKKGFIVNADTCVHVVADLKAGTGTRVIEYNETERELKAVKARLEKIEAELAKLRKAK